MVIVSQLGARHRYLIPKILFKNNLLTRLYTDTYSDSTLGRIVSKIPFDNISLIKKIKNRKIENIDKEKIFSTDIIAFNKLISLKEPSMKKIHSLFFEFMKKNGFNKAKILYRLSSECFEYAEYAKKNGLTIITDMFISPINNEIDYEESLSYGHIYNNKMKRSEIEFIRKRYINIINLSDILLCPSEFVANGVLQLVPTVKNKIRIIPYGSSIEYNKSIFEERVQSCKVASNFIFVGTDPMRKGLHYLAEAATKIKRKYPDIKFKVAGLNGDGVFKNDLFKDLIFLGKLNTKELKKEYINSDCLILPSLCEGLPGVILEALSLSLPVICTKSSGVIFKYGFDGFNIQEKSSDDIVKTIIYIRKNKDSLKKVIRNIPNKLDEFSESNWEKNLVNLIRYKC